MSGDFVGESWNQKTAEEFEKIVTNRIYRGSHHVFDDVES